MDSTLVCVFFIPWGHVENHAQIWAFVTSISHMGQMRDSDWSRENLLRSDWLGLNGAIMTTLEYLLSKVLSNCPTEIHIAWNTNFATSAFYRVHAWCYLVEANCGLFKLKNRSSRNKFFFCANNMISISRLNLTYMHHWFIISGLKYRVIGTKLFQGIYSETLWLLNFWNACEVSKLNLPNKEMNICTC